MSDRRLIVTADDYHMLHDEHREALDQWIESVTGRPIGERPLIMSVTLGEGWVSVEEDIDQQSDEGEWKTAQVPYPAPAMPPVWPAGWSETRRGVDRTAP